MKVLTKGSLLFLVVTIYLFLGDERGRNGLNKKINTPEHGRVSRVTILEVPLFIPEVWRFCAECRRPQTRSERRRCIIQPEAAFVVVEIVSSRTLLFQLPFYSNQASLNSGLQVSSAISISINASCLTRRSRCGQNQRFIIAGCTPPFFSGIGCQ